MFRHQLLYASIKKSTFGHCPMLRNVRFQKKILQAIKTLQSSQCFCPLFGLSCSLNAATTAVQVATTKDADGSLPKAMAEEQMWIILFYYFIYH